MLAFRKPRAGAHAQVLALLMGLPLAAAATPCMYRGMDADARVINRSGEISTPFPVSMSSNDCGRLRVASGTVSVYMLNAQGALGTPLQVSRGPLVPASEAGAAGGADSGILKQIVVVLEGVNRTKNGSSRGAEGDYLVASLPVGHLAEPSADLSLELGPVPDLNFASFELLVGGKTVHRQSGPTQWIKLPLAILKPGASVRWKLDYSGSKYEGAFVVEPAATLDALKQSLAKDAPADADELVGKLRIAAGLNQQGYAWDARALIRAVLSP